MSSDWRDIVLIAVLPGLAAAHLAFMASAKTPTSSGPEPYSRVRRSRGAGVILANRFRERRDMRVGTRSRMRNFVAIRIDPHHPIAVLGLESLPRVVLRMRRPVIILRSP